MQRDRAGFMELQKVWQRKLYEAGLVGMNWPKEYGGYEASITQQVIASEEMARADCPPSINRVGLGILAPTLIQFANEQQKRRFLPKILIAEEIWCQGFSEPDAGSDLASLKTRAEDKGDHFLVNGQKVWSSAGPIADWCFFLARTDPSRPKREGMSLLLVDVKTKGLTIRPLLTPTGAAHFAEIFFDNVEVPKENLVGELNQGWQIAKATLASERSAIADVVALEGHFRRLWKMAHQLGRDGRPVLAEPVNRRALAQTWIEIEALRHLGYRNMTEQLEGKTSGGPTSSVGKLFGSETRQRLMQTALKLEGPLAQIGKRSLHSIENGRWQQLYIDSRAYTIGGGTSEVNRNVVAERVLRLPKSVED